MHVSSPLVSLTGMAQTSSADMLITTSSSSDAMCPVTSDFFSIEGAENSFQHTLCSCELCARRQEEETFQPNIQLTEKQKQIIIETNKALAEKQGIMFDESQFDFGNIQHSFNPPSPTLVRHPTQTQEKSIPTFINRDDGEITPSDMEEIFESPSVYSKEAFIQLKPEFAWLAESDAFTNKTFTVETFYKAEYDPNTNEIKLLGLDMSGWNLSGSTFQPPDSIGASFYGANLQGANLQGSNLSDSTFYQAYLQGIQHNDSTAMNRTDFIETEFFAHYNEQGQYIDYSEPEQYLEDRGILPSDISPEELQHEFDLIKDFGPVLQPLYWSRAEYRVRYNRGEENPGQVFDYLVPTKTSDLTDEELAAYEELEQAVMEYVTFERGSLLIDSAAYPSPDEREPYTDPSLKALFARRVADAFYQTDPERQAQIINTFRDDNDGSPGTKIYLSSAKGGKYGGTIYWPGNTGVNSGIEGDPGDIAYSIYSFMLGMAEPNTGYATDIHEIVHYLDSSNPSEDMFYLDNYLSGMPGTNETVGEEIRSLVRDIVVWYLDETIPEEEKVLIHESLREYFFTHGQLILDSNEGQIEQSPVFMEVFFERPDMILNPHPNLDPRIKMKLRQLAEIFGEYTHPYEFFIPQIQKAPRLEITTNDQFYITENRQVGTTVGVVEANDISHPEGIDPNITYEMGTIYPGGSGLVSDPRFHIDEDGIIRTDIELTYVDVNTLPPGQSNPNVIQLIVRAKKQGLEPIEQKITIEIRPNTIYLPIVTR